MSPRETLCRQFLAQTPYADWQRGALAGDASNRRYERLRSAEGRSVVLMDAPPEKGESIAAFVRIARHLREQGLSAPEILAQDEANGFLLLEDLGDDLFARVVRRQPELEQTLYAAATDALVALHAAPLPKLEPYGPRVLAELAGLVLPAYRDAILGAPRCPPAGPVHRPTGRHPARHAAWRCGAGAARFSRREPAVAAGPRRRGRVGMLDFQDARAGHRAFDLMSLLQDARRDVPAAIEMQMIDRYIAATGVDGSGFRTAYAVLGVLRALRILGVFARLSREYGKPQYLGYMPRVWDHLMRGLEHPAMAPAAEMLRSALPAPTPENLERLKP